MSLLHKCRCTLLFFHFVQEYPLSEEELLALRMDEVRLCLYTSLIFGHALLKIVQNLLLRWCCDHLHQARKEFWAVHVWMSSWYITTTATMTLKSYKTLALYSGHIHRKRYEVWPVSRIYFHGFISHSLSKNIIIHERLLSFTVNNIKRLNSVYRHYSNRMVEN